MGDGLTIFAIPRGFEGEHAVVQENALQSWTRLEPRPEIVLFCDDAGVGEAAERFGCRWVPDIARSEGTGRPIFGEAFLRAQEMAAHDTLCYANCDIILLQDFMEALARTRARFGEFLMVGRRHNVPVPTDEPLCFVGDGWRERVKKLTRRFGGLHRGCAVDWFAFSRGLFAEFPPFVVGAEKMDHWIVSDVLARSVPVVDATAVVLTVHQGYSAKVPKSAEWHYNKRLYEAWHRGDAVGHVEEASWVLEEDGFRKR